MTKIITLIFFTLIGVCSYANAQLITYKAPEGSLLNSDFSVKVRQKGKVWKTLPVYLASVANCDAYGKVNSENTSFSYFDFSGEAEIAVTYNKGTVKAAKVRPLSSAIPKVTGNTITFSLTEPRSLSIEINGDIFHNLQLFANPLETFHPLPSDTSVIYYGPGIHEAGTVVVPSNKTIYIAGGAVVRGNFRMNRVHDVKILGRGIIEHAGGPIDIAFSQDILVDGIIMANPKHNTVGIGSSDHITVRNLKSFSDQGWGDGIDIFCSSNVLIDNVFMRNSDDCIAIYGHRNKYYGNTQNITVKNSALWADVAHPILIGTHGDPPHPDTLSDMKFINLDILDQHENQLDYQGCLALNAGDANLIKNISFDNIRIDNIRKGQLVNMRIMYNHKYNTAPGKGIENVYFKDVSYQGNRANLSIIAGYDETRTIKNVVFENLKINGKLITDKMPGKPGYYKTGDMANIFIGEHVNGITFIPSKK